MSRINFGLPAAFVVLILSSYVCAEDASKTDVSVGPGKIVVEAADSQLLFFKAEPTGQTPALGGVATTESFTGKVIRQSLELEAEDYVIKVAGSKGKTLKLHDKSLLNWTNPSRRTEQGVVMVWHDEGLPRAIASLFTYEWQGTKEKHEFVSLSDAKLEATYNGQLAWAPDQPGVKWHTWSNGRRDSSRVASSERRRLLQMRSIAREFKVTMKDERDKTSSLRLLTEPLHRFKSEKHGVIDGAIFAFAFATDPEALLVVRGDEDDKQWKFGFVPSIYYELTATHKEQVVWHLDSVLEQHINNVIGNQRLMGDTYLSYHLTANRAFRPHPDVKKKEEAE